jgi:hypothetical protein
MTIVSNPMSRFPMQDLSLLWNFQHGRCAVDGTTIRDMAPSRNENGVAFAGTLTNGPVFQDGIEGAKGITFDGSNDYVTLDGSDTRFDAGEGAGGRVTDMYWVNIRLWKNFNICQWGNNSQRWTQWAMAESVYNVGWGFGKQYSNSWLTVTHSNEGITFDDPAGGGVYADFTNKWWCLAITNPYPDEIKPYIMGDPAVNIKRFNVNPVVVSNIVKVSSGQIGHGADGYIPGAIGFFASWNRALSDAEVKLAFNATKGYFGVQ